MLISPEQIAQFNTNPLYRTTGIQALSAEDGNLVAMGQATFRIFPLHERA